MTYTHLAATILFSGTAIFAQPQPKLEFEVVSIKPGSGDVHQVRMSMTPGRMSAKNVPTKMLLMQAFNVKDFQLTGGPAWMASTQWDIEAKMATDDDQPKGGPPNPAQQKAMAEKLRAMMQSMLVDRFKLKFHEDSKESPAYALVVGKNGPKLKKSESGPEARSMMRMGHGQLNASRTTMENFAGQLANQVGRPVVDKTGLAGEYDIELEWTPDPGRSGPFGQPPPGDAPPPVDANGPTIYTAVQEKLGLKLEATKAPVKMIVIDWIEKPSEN